MASISSAATYVIWDNQTGDNNWNNGLKLEHQFCPAEYSNYLCPYPDDDRTRITTGQTVSVYRVYLDGAGNGTLTMNGGTP